MTDEELQANIQGAALLIKHFGYWPSFHDAEVVGIELHRAAPSRLSIHTFATTGDLTESGHYRTEKHAVVSFVLEDVQTADLHGFNHQNVISVLLLRRLEEGFEVVLGGCYGVEGSIVAKRVRIEVEHGMPPGSIYEQTVA